jgi:superfamily II DNA or RNA helicase
MLQCTVELIDEVNARIGGLRPEHLKFLWDKYGIFVDGYRYMPAFQLRRWDGKQRYFSDTGVTYTKLIPSIVPFLVNWGYEINISDKRLPTPVIDFQVDAEFFMNPSFKLRPYQVEVVNKLLLAGSGFAICATGAGKTSMCAALSAVLVAHELRTLIIVPSTDLVNQTADEFRERLASYITNDILTVGTYSGSVKDIDNHDIVIATWQSLQNAPHYMFDFNAVIVDEAHGAKAEVIKELINVHGRHISYRYGVTGTFPKSEVDQYSLRLSIGEILVTIPASWLIAQGYLSSVEIEAVETADAVEEFPDYASEKSYLTKSDDRLLEIAALIQKKQQAHGNTMVLVNSIAQGQSLQEMIPNSIFLHGETDTSVRAEHYAQYEDSNNLIVIATFGIASTGLSINRIFCLIMIDAGKSFVRCIQSIGRGLRKSGDKNHVFVVDVYSKLKFSKKHFKNRKDFYVEAGYPISKPVKLKYLTNTDSGSIVF